MFGPSYVAFSACVPDAFRGDGVSQWSWGVSAQGAPCPALPSGP